jgi:hypothetical protein
VAFIMHEGGHIHRHTHTHRHTESIFVEFLLLPPFPPLHHACDILSSSNNKQEHNSHLTCTHTHTYNPTHSNHRQMAARVPLSCCSGAACGGTSAAAGLAAAAAPFLVNVGSGGGGGALDLGYWLGFQDSYSTKAPLTLKVIVSLIRTLEGRDKITKVCPLID